MAYSGKFRPTKPRKYKGDPTNIVFRSLWELKFMKYCDTNKNIIKWASEEHVIRYKLSLIHIWTLPTTPYV